MTTRWQAPPLPQSLTLEYHPPPLTRMDFDVVVYGATAAGIAAAVASAPARTALVVTSLEERVPGHLGGMVASGGLGLHDQRTGNDTAVTGLARRWCEYNGASYYHNSRHAHAHAHVATDDHESQASMSRRGRRRRRIRTKFTEERPCVYHPDSFVGMQSFRRMLDETPSVVVVGDQDSVVGEGGCSLSSGMTFEGIHIATAKLRCYSSSSSSGRLDVELLASVWIDASYDADLVRSAPNGAVSWTYGRESYETYNESLAGIQYVDNTSETFGDMVGSVFTFDKNEPLPEGLVVDKNAEREKKNVFSKTKPFASEGTGDRRLMAFQHRLCLTTSSWNLVPLEPPPNYNASHYPLLQKFLSRQRRKRYPDPFEKYVSLGKFSDEYVYDANKRVVCCGRTPINSDLVGLNDNWVTSTKEQKAAIALKHRHQLQGFLWTLLQAGDDVVPNVTKYGLCSDEFPENDHWPPLLYVRVSARLVGDYVLTQNDFPDLQKASSGASAMNISITDDSVSMAVWELDSHLVSRRAVEVETTNPDYRLLRLRNEGYFRCAITPEVHVCNVKKIDHRNYSYCDPNRLWYNVPFRVMLPKRKEVGNLLVPVAISTSAVAYTSARIETMFMDLGSAAGVAVRLFVQNQNSSNISETPGTRLHIQDVVNVTDVQRILEKEFRQRIRGPWW